MDFSGEWRSLWPVSGVFAAPGILSSPSSSAAFGPLLFGPASPPLPLLSSPSLALRVPPPLDASSLADGLRAFFRSASSDAFLPSAALHSLAGDLLPAGGSGTGDPVATNNLHALPCRDGSSMVLFFPTGENAHLIGYVGLSFKKPDFEIRVDRDGDVFKQKDGFKHSCHRILKISVAPKFESWARAGDLEPTGSNSIVEGFLVATTLYAANWFRVESRFTDSGKKRPFLVPLAKQGFESPVVHACWSPHFQEESAVLLESGDLCWLNMDSRCGGTMRVAIGDGDPGEWLSCEFGGQPWIVIVACSTAVVMVDLRFKEGTGNKVLARIDSLCSFSVASLMERNDRIFGFCKAGYSDFHMSVVTEHQLHLFDSRQPLFPILTWDHGLDCPCYVAMFRLSELRPSDEFKWASDSGYAILVGSFCTGEFSLFCYGPREKGALSESPLYAWELPSSFSLSGHDSGSGDRLVREIFPDENLPDGSEWPRKKEIIVGFSIVTDDVFRLQLEPAGFSVIRLTSSGKLEMQRYHASSGFSRDEFHCKENDCLELEDSFICSNGQEDRISTRYYFMKLSYLYEYMNGNLSKAVAVSNSQSEDHMGSNQIAYNIDMKKLISNTLKCSNLSVSAFISDASIPTSIFEIALRRILSSLRLDLLPLAFSRYKDLFGCSRDSSFEFLEVPSCLPHNNLLPFFVVKPSRRSEKWMNRASPEEDLVGPVLPPPVLLTLQQQMDRQTKSASFQNEEPYDNLLNLGCKTVLENVYPEVSIADTENSIGWGASEDPQDEKPFFVYEPAQIGTRSTCNKTSSVSPHAIKEELPQTDNVKQPCLVPCKDEKFATLICRIADKTCGPNTSNEEVGIEMLDLSPIRLDFDSSSMVFQPDEQKIFKCLKRQFSKWQGNYKPYQDFCTSSKIPKLPA